MKSQEQIKDSIPSHLRQFVVEQDYSMYTPEDHAVWRFIMRQQKKYLQENAHEVYMEGLEKAGISIETIPNIEEMNHCLAQVGWRAVVVDGYIPTAAFMEFHSHKIMPIAVDMRSIEHILYTPAPDIVHEAAGHAPFLIDIDYNEYLQKFGEYGLKAIYNKKDEEIYEGVREVSILKEDPKATAQEIKKAEERLSQSIANLGTLSESSLLGRLYWWTVEYGLVGTIDNYKIFGAGLLSSLAESRSCLDDHKVKKIPYAVDAEKTAFDITDPQPQLFVTKSCRHMRQVLEEFAETMCFRQGGANAIKEVIEAGTVNTAVYSSGLQVSGKFVAVKTNSVNRETYINTQGPTQLSYDGRQLEGHGINYHAEGFGSPVGGLQGIDTPLEDLSMDELKEHGIHMNELVQLDFLSGIIVKGRLIRILRENGKNLIFTFEDCVVRDLEGQILFQPEWGAYDMGVGRRIVSVFAGSADRSEFDTYPPKSTRTIAQKTYTPEQQHLFIFYKQVREMREQDQFDLKILQSIHQALQDFPQNWLLRWEIWELCQGQPAASELCGQLQNELEGLRGHSDEYEMLICMALAS